jgi:electron-transferring-flavoprotein dehydrogenase
MGTETYDIVVVGGGTAGAFAAAAAAKKGCDVALLERKPAEQAGHIACGDALKAAGAFPDAVDTEYLREESITNGDLKRALFLNPEGENYEYQFREDGAIVDRKRFGEVLLEEADRAGAQLHYNTVVKDVRQNGRVRGVDAVRDGDPVTYESDVVIDAAGSLSLLQDKVDFEGTHYDTNVDYSQFCSAYREVIETPDPVEYDDALVFKPTAELGYLWYFPRSLTVVNAGLGFQMSEPSIPLVEVLRRDLQTRPEFENAHVRDKLGAALPTRRPYDSAVAAGFLSAGDAAGHVNPTNGEGISGAAKAGNWAGNVAADAVSEGDLSEANLWGYNRAVQASFGRRHAALDLYNILGTAHETAEITALIDGLPGQQLFDIITERGRFSPTLREMLSLGTRTLVGTRGNWDLLYEGYRVKRLADQIKEIYREFPTSPDGFEAWRDRRDEVVEEVYELTGADPKY